MLGPTLFSMQEAIITGTTDCEKCREFAKAYFRAVIIAFTGGKIDLNHPLSVTHVFEIIVKISPSKNFSFA